ncbi:MAG: hypothetical protein ACNI27_07855 [Desulfovibrio sp.]
MPATKLSLFEAFLTSRDSLELYLNGTVPDSKTLLSSSFITVRRRTAYKPDYVYKNEQARVYPTKTTPSILLKSVNGLSDHYLRGNGKTQVVPMTRFSDWQRLITRVSPLLLTVSAIRSHCKKTCHMTPEEAVGKVVKYSALATMDCRVLDGVLSKRGLAELHMHLNGTTEADKVWLDALVKPEPYVDALKDALNTKVHEQLSEVAHCLDELRDVLHLLHAARYVRQKLGNYLYDREKILVSNRGNSSPYTSEWLGRIFDKNTFFDEVDLDYSPAIHPVVYYNPSLELDTPLAQEGRLLNDALQALEDGDPIVASMFHFYLLAQSCFCGLLVQQVNQSGFDQFQRIADNKLRDPSEVDYEYRYNQIMHHMPGDKCHLEGRFAPKKTIAKNGALLSKVIRGWDSHNTPENKSGPIDKALSLTAHFIKIPDKNKAPLFRHHQIRKKLLGDGLRLIHIRKMQPKFKAVMTSADAAANELHAPPEVFASVFRLLRAKGCKNFTFHVGEDFHHVVSGLRAMWEAITFLELSSGDRIGHGTAVGISPKLWADRMGETIAVSRQEWLDNLLFIYSQLRHDTEFSHRASRYADMVRQQANIVYGGKRPSLSDLRKAWKMRHLEPHVVFSHFFDKTISISHWLEREEKLAKNLIDNFNKDAFKVFESYHTDKDVRLLGAELIEVKTESVPLEIITRLQEAIIKLMQSRQIAMEVMPSSNVRIATYEEYTEHHIYRLLGYTEDALPNHPTMCIASDDPGIFASCLRNEYAHVYKGLLDHGVEEREALSVIEELINNGWAYSFTPPK